jgi:hypothetical protein
MTRTDQRDTRFAYFVCRKSDGRIWKAGHTVLGLCSAWNHATNPRLYLTDAEHHRSRIYARSIKARMARLGIKYGTHYIERSDGSLWPIKTA